MSNYYIASLPRPQVLIHFWPPLQRTNQLSFSCVAITCSRKPVVIDLTLSDQIRESSSETHHSNSLLSWRCFSFAESKSSSSCSILKNNTFSETQHWNSQLLQMYCFAAASMEEFSSPISASPKGLVANPWPTVTRNACHKYYTVYSTADTMTYEIATLPLTLYVQDAVCFVHCRIRSNVNHSSTKLMEIMNNSNY